MKKVALAALIIGVVGLAVRAQDELPGTVFIMAGDAGRTVTISRHGTVLASFVLPKGTLLSARDDTHPTPNHVGGGRFEFHGNFELRAMAASDRRRDAPGNGVAAVLLRYAPMVVAAQDVDVVIERTGQQ